MKPIYLILVAFWIRTPIICHNWVDVISITAGMCLFIISAYHFCYKTETK